MDADCGALNDYEQDYAWVKRGLIFPFVDFVDRCISALVHIVFIFFFFIDSFCLPEVFFDDIGSRSNLN